MRISMHIQYKGGLLPTGHTTHKKLPEDAGKWLCGQLELDDSNCSEAACCHFPAASKKFLKNRYFLLSKLWESGLVAVTSRMIQFVG